ncbi:hypothetical protein KJZ13_05120 [Cutibacterium avidum]|uniref:hypothetical protein n=1 Tax=Cutibacterium avidum TaxID=33010 RepID=UPI0020925A79|nr:hypothetical protein [Cutibacterium avidum]MCO6680230.1 hypothetical protein [Cutibacterium avidum]
MTPRPVNDAQREVLDWLAAGGSQDPPRPEMKLSAAALAARGLVKVRRPGGKWTAELTETGRYYVEHGRYPGEVEQAERPPAPRTRRAGSPARLGTQDLSPAPAETREPVVVPQEPQEQVPLRQVVRRPHPAVKELRDRPGRLPMPLRRRCVLVAHSLVTEALARGWTVTPVEARREPDGYRGTYLRYPNQALLLLDAGHATVGIVFSEVTKRRPHEDTKEEAARRAKGQYVGAPRYDYVGDGRLRLHLTDHDGRKTGASWTDGARVKVEERLAEVIAAVEAASQRAVRMEQERRRREEEERLRREEVHRVEQLRRGYEEWEQALHARADAWTRHREMAAFVDEVERAIGEEGHPFVEWARGHLAAVDPRRVLPSGAVPTWTHEERARHGRYEPKPTYRW